MNFENTKILFHIVSKKMHFTSMSISLKINTSVKTGTNVSIFPLLSINRCLEFFPNNYSPDNKTNLTIVSFQ